MKKLFTIAAMCVALLGLSLPTFTSELEAAPVPTAQRASTPGCDLAADGWYECGLSESNYIGWTLWEYCKTSGICKKWADKYKIRINFRMFPNYGKSIDAFLSNEYPAVTLTNMDTLLAPADGGIKTETIAIGDYSNGNDGCVSRVCKDFKCLQGKKVKMMAGTVSDFMFSLKAAKEGIPFEKFIIENTDENAIVAAFNSDPNATAVTWLPFLLDLKAFPGAHLIFDSSEFPEVILDNLVVRLDAPADFKKALTGAWFETVAVLKGKQGRKAKAEMIAIMGEACGDFTPPQVQKMLKTTFMYWTPAKAIAVMTGQKIQETMRMIAEFSVEQGIAKDMKTPTDYGIQYPDGTVYGNKRDVRIIFTDEYMKMARDGKL
jgi:NitT/TauT family transport system substrate-binding protein